MGPLGGIYHGYLSNPNNGRRVLLDCDDQPSSAGLVNEQWLAHIGDFGYRAFEVERLGQHNLEDLSGSDIAQQAVIVVDVPFAH